MKKNYFLFALMFVNIAIFKAQQSNIDFETFNLTSSDTFYNGSDFSGGFSFNSFGNTVLFENYYDTTWGPYWTGFSYSNVTNNTTPGYQNQYSAFTGSGSQGSEKYGVYYSNGKIRFSQDTRIDSLKITNTTFAALSMLHGDAFSKKFGTTTNANGEIDGTNGNDFFKIWIFGLDGESNKIDSLEFYLADYRFVNDEDDYVLNTWKTIDLSHFGLNVRFLDFKFESSDMSFGFINTPSYFAIDDIHITHLLSQVDKNLKDEISVFPNPIFNSLHVNTNISGEIIIRNVEGKEILSISHHEKSTIDFSNYQNGVYFVTILDANKKHYITKKVVK